MPKSWERVGIEFEYTDVSLTFDKKFQAFLNGFGYQITHDASVESPSQGYDSMPIKGRILDEDIDKIFIGKLVLGGELVSPILDISNNSWIKRLDHVLGVLKEKGERSYTNRGSIHVHVNFPVDKDTSVGRIIKSWIMAGFLEAFFFRIGCMSRHHRGDNFDYIYCRPITSNGPPIVRNSEDGLYYPLLVFNEVLESKDLDEFFYRCGDIYHAESRYHPSRYMWINYYNVGKESSHLEFRIFNKTLRSDYLYTIVKLCSEFVRVAFTKSTEWVISHSENGKTYSIANPPKNPSYFYDCMSLLNIEDTMLFQTLKEIWDKSEYPAYDDYPVFSHLIRGGARISCFWDKAYQNWNPDALQSSQLQLVREPDFIDVHKLHDGGNTIFPEEKGCAS